MILSAALKPPRLRAGARVALVSPAGPVTEERVAAALRQCELLQLDAVLGRATSERIGYLAGSDAARANDLASAIDDPSVDAIWALRGGYGTMRLLRRLDLSPLHERPKAFIGFSDNTALHHAFARAGLVSFHGPHAGGPFPALTETCFRRVLFEAEPAGMLPLPAGEPAPCALRGGTAEGVLTGGNLSLLAALCGTGIALQARDRIVILEDVGEATYRIDRALTQLLLAGALEGAAALALGRFTERPETTHDLRLEDVFGEIGEQLGVPTVLGFPVGHVDTNWCLPFGVRARLDADQRALTLLESAVS